MIMGEMRCVVIELASVVTDTVELPPDLEIVILLMVVLTKTGEGVNVVVLTTVIRVTHSGHSSEDVDEDVIMALGKLSSLLLGCSLEGVEMSR